MSALSMMLDEPSKTLGVHMSKMHDSHGHSPLRRHDNAQRLRQRHAAADNFGQSSARQCLTSLVF
jgi:hypothetical protein